MICPNCNQQMHQKDKQGGGVSRDDYYETWEIKACPSCRREVKEFYSVSLIKKEEL